MGRIGAVCAVLVGLTGSAQASVEDMPGQRLAPGGRYVALGSSFAAGAGLPANAQEDRCHRSEQNYAHLLAAKRQLALTDVSCGGAATANVIGPWNDLPPQLDALDDRTRLVTVTIGGNDVGYLRSLMALSCRRQPPVGRTCPSPIMPDDAAWRATEQGLRSIAAEVRRRAPSARLVFVDYLTVLPEHGVCPAVPLSEAEADAMRAMAQRLADLTADIASETGSGLVQASVLSKGHDACAENAWVFGWVQPTPARSPYHPNADGMQAIADALDRLI